MDNAQSSAGVWASSQATDQVKRRFQMSHRFLHSVGALGGVIAAALLATTPVGGQARPSEAKTTAAAKVWIPPRTADGQPDLQGIWTNTTLTPFERSKDLAGKEFFTEKEAAEYEKGVLEGTIK